MTEHLPPRRDCEKAVELLEQAAKLLEAKHPQLSTTFRGPDGSQYFARFCWPGVVLVYDNNLGELAARSLAGRPRTLASS